MRLTSSVVATVLVLPSSILADTTNMTGTSTISGESLILPGVDVPLALITTAPKHGFAIEEAAVGGAPLTIHVRNNGGISGLHVAWQRNTPNIGNLNGVHNAPLGSSTMGVYPTGWSGRIGIGRDPNPNVIQKGSVIEADFKNGLATVDVSYVRGYTVPISCSANGAVVTGCDVPLFWTKTACPNEQGGPICYNPNFNSGQPRGTRTQAFFQPCQGAAMTYPSDLAGQATNMKVNEIFCCVGHGCPRNPKQHSKKRSIGGHVKHHAGGSVNRSPVDDA